ncbi:hypothetical protein METP3_00550 [Methanosarcinales archaeon]|nr:hypothetical protein METP3_00550 [Methanosarcinales archaeon]
MNSKQILLFLLLFMVALVVMTLPLWIDKALPIMRNSINSAGKTFEEMLVSLKYISERLSQDVTKLLDKYLQQD